MLRIMSKMLGIVFLLVLASAGARVYASETTFVETINVSSTNPVPVYATASLEPGERYIIDVVGTYNFATWISGWNADAGYGTFDGWQSTSSFLGIHPTTVMPETGTLTPGLSSLLVDFGAGIQLADWGAYRSDHHYQYEFIAAASTLGFVISDWWSDWYGNYPASFNRGMGDNAGYLTVTIYKKQDDIPARISLQPNTLNLRSNGAWVTAYIQLPAATAANAWSASAIDVSSIKLNGSVPAESRPTAIGDFFGDGNLALMVKFKRADVQAILTAGDAAPVTITGALATGQQFTGNAAIRAIQ